MSEIRNATNARKNNYLLNSQREKLINEIRDSKHRTFLMKNHVQNEQIDEENIKIYQRLSSAKKSQRGS